MGFRSGKELRNVKCEMRVTIVPTGMVIGVPPGPMSTRDSVGSRDTLPQVRPPHSYLSPARGSDSDLGLVKQLDL